jgi:membrane protein YdbS with pleckstrin-like domain
MAYVDSQLLPGEQVIYRAHMSRLLFLPAIGVAALAVGAGIVSASIPGFWMTAAALAVIAAIVFLGELILYKSSEFAVTDRRVIIKVGWIRRRTMETMLGKIEALGVQQGMLGRMFNFGTITVTGTGGTQETFDRIGAPLEFRKQVQSAAMVADERRAASQGFIAELGGVPGVREERECPYCAERILVRAKVCRFCGRDLAQSPS